MEVVIVIGICSVCIVDPGPFLLKIGYSSLMQRNCVVKIVKIPGVVSSRSEFTQQLPEYGI